MENENQNKNTDITRQMRGIISKYPIASKVGIVLAAIVVILAVIWFMAARSLPGSALYPLKTDFFETLDSSVQLSNEARADQHVHLLANRFNELKMLVAREEISSKAIEDLQTQVERNTQGVYEALNAEGESSLQSQNALRILEDLVGLTSAMEVIGESDARFGEFGEFMEDARREATNTYGDRVDRFVEREMPDVIYEFIKTQLTRVSRELENDTLPAEVIDDAEVYINRVAPAMSEGDLPRAINAIAEALRFIRIESLGANTIAQSLRPDVSSEPVDENASTTPQESATTTVGSSTVEDVPAADSFQFVQ